MPIRILHWWSETAANAPLEEKNVLCLHIGHWPLADSCLIHSMMQCWVLLLAQFRKTACDVLLTMWKLCPHFPATVPRFGQTVYSKYPCNLSAAFYLRMGHSSPGNLHVGHVASKWTWQMPQTSSSGMSHLHVATACHSLIVTFMMALPHSCLRRFRAMLWQVVYSCRVPECSRD